MLYIFTIIADLLTFDILNMQEGKDLTLAVHFFIEDVLSLCFLTAVIVFVMGLFKHELSTEKVRNYLNGKPKYIAYILAVVLGWITPFCSCSSVPLFIAFISAGIPLHIAMTFLVVSPMPIESVMILGTLIDFGRSMLYMFLCGLAGILFGIIVEKLHWEKYLNNILQRAQKMPEISSAQVDTTIINHKYTWKQRINDSLEDVKNIFQSIWLWLIIGIAIGAIFHGYVPNEIFAEFSNRHPYLTVPLSVLIGIPLYANNTSIIPVMEALYLKGVPLGTVLTLMISATSISLPELVILHKILKAKLLLWLISFLMLVFILIGIGFNWWFA